MPKLTKKSIWLLLMLAGLWLGACSSPARVPQPPLLETLPVIPVTNPATVTPPALTETHKPLMTNTRIPVETATLTQQPTVSASDHVLADVISVTAHGTENAYTFAVEIRSPDTGCEQYADWWEVITENGALIYRRILVHSHVNEQPFTRSGGSVLISPDDIVIVRAHMHPGGYGGAAFRGTVSEGFEKIPLEADFAPELENMAPLPDGCAF